MKRLFKETQVNRRPISRFLSLILKRLVQSFALSLFSLLALGGLFGCEDALLCSSPADCAEGFICDLDGYCTQLTAYVRCGDGRCFAPEVCVDGERCMVVDRAGSESGGTDILLAGIMMSQDQGGVAVEDAMSAGTNTVQDRGEINGGTGYTDFRVRDMSLPLDMSNDPLLRDQGGQDCRTACDCPHGLSCSAGMCITESEPVYCCDASFCPPGEGCQNESGSRDLCSEATCQTACDCNPGLSCIAGACVLDSGPLYCCDRGSCPSGASCESAGGVRSMCPAEACTSACDCTPSQRCVEGACLLQGDPVFCCDQGSCPSGEICQNATGTMAMCHDNSDCQTACDCMSGMSCVEGGCELGQQPIFCCDEGFCPVGERCESASGGPQSLCGE